MSYNGWTNYETWNYKLWIDNEYESQKFWQAQTEELAARYKDRDTTIYALAKLLQADIEDAAYDLCYRETYPTGCLSDLLSHAIHRINFEEIAEHLYEDYIWEEEHGN